MRKLQDKKSASHDVEAGVRATVGTAPSTSKEEIDERAIARRAYQLWLERGCPEGSPEEDWYHAERELGIAGKPAEQEDSAPAAGPAIRESVSTSRAPARVLS